MAKRVEVDPQVVERLRVRLSSPEAKVALAQAMADIDRIDKQLYMARRRPNRFLRRHMTI